MAGTDTAPWEDYAQDAGPWQDYAQKSPASTAQSTTAEPKPMTSPHLSDFVPDENTLPNLASGIASGAGNLASGIAHTVFHPIDTLKGAAHTIGQSYDLAKQGQYIPAAATAMGLAGFDEPRLAKLWNEGKGSEAVGEALPQSIADAVAAEKMTRRGSLTVNGQTLGDMAKKAVSRVSVADDWHVPGTPLKIALRQPLEDRFGNEISIPGAESEMQTDIQKGLLQRSAARAKMESDLSKRPSITMPDNATLTTGNNLPPASASAPSTSPVSVTSPVQATFMREIPKATSITSAAGSEGEGPIGSGPTERAVQTLMQKPVLTPEEYEATKRILGPNANLRSGEGLTDWRSRVTGKLKAARPRTE